MAGFPEGARVNRNDLAVLAEVPAEFLGKVLQSLSKAQLILSRRGVSGGYELARSAERITMLDVVEALEGPLQLNHCLGSERACGRSWWCGAHEKWNEAQEALAAVLRGATIAELAKRSQEKRQGGSSLIAEIESVEPGMKEAPVIERPVQAAGPEAEAGGLVWS